MRYSVVWPRALIVIALAASGTLAPLNRAFSEEPVVDGEIRALIESFPQGDRAGERGTVIDRSNARKYRKVLIPELYSLVRGGEFHLEAAQRLAYAWRFDDGWERGEAGTRAASLLPGGLLPDSVRRGKGFVFGRAVELDQDRDLQARAAKMLWNLESLYWGQRVLKYGFSVALFDQNEAKRIFSGDLVRVYPSPDGNGDKAQKGQVFRERVEIVLQPPMRRVRFLTFRFLGQDEDAVWILSPATQKVRELTGSNRTDPMITLPISLEDLLVWGGKPELHEATVDGKVQALVPFPSLRLENAERAEECYRVAEKASLGEIVRWNSETRRFAEGAPWVPTNVTFVPRHLWKLEVFSRDPFSLSGRQILYIDSEMMLPVYKFVFDRSGRKTKSVIGSYGLALGDDKQRKVPYPAFVLAVNHLKKEAVAVTYRNRLVCDAERDGLRFAELVPGKIVEEKAVPQGEKPVEKKPEEKQKAGA